MAHLDDNTRTGLHALGLGLLVIGIPVVVVQLIDLYQTVSVTTDHSTLKIFRNGYLLPEDGPQFCIATSARMERVGMAAFAALLAGSGLALLSVPLRRWLSPWSVGRWSAALVLVFLSWSALVRPSRSVKLEKNSLTIVEHPVLFGDLTLPSTTIEQVNITPEWTWVSEVRKDGRQLLFAQYGDRRIEVGSTFAGEASVHAALEFLHRDPHAE
jgi:hypothetical protein